MEIEEMTAAQVAEELDRISADGDELRGDELARANALLDRADTLAAEEVDRAGFRDRRERTRQALADALDRGQAGEDDDPSQDDLDRVNRDRSDGPARRAARIWDLEVIGRAETDELVSRLQDAVELLGLPSERAAALAQVAGEGEGETARVALMTLQPAYRTAFARYLQTGVWLQGASPAERQAADATEPLRRAMSVASNGAGGYLVAADIDPSVVIAADGAQTTVLDLATKVTTTAATYRVNSAPNATWSWDGENTEVSDDAVTFTPVDISLFVAQGLYPMSIASLQSIAGAMSIARKVMTGGYEDLVAAATTTGAGGTQPVGIVTALTGTASVVASAAADTLAAPDLFSVRDALAQRYRRRSTWIYDIGFESLARQLATADNYSMWARLSAGEQPVLLGRPTRETPDMDGTLTAGADNYMAILGDFGYYYVATAIGTLAEVIPHLFGANGRPTGTRGLYMQTRFGADSVLDAAFRMYNVT